MANNVNLSFPPAYNQQFLNANGKPYANGRLYTYKAGTRESIVTYKTIGSTDTANMNTNPIILDMAGRAEVVIEKDKSYKFVLTDRFGTFVKLWDNISANSGEGGGGGGEEYTASLPIVIDENNNISNNGANLSVSGANSWAEGYGTKASGNSSHAEGYYSNAVGSYSHAEGGNSEAIGPYSHAEGYECVAGNSNEPSLYKASHAEGYMTESTGLGSHSEGYMTKATEVYAHAEGTQTEASDVAAHAEGDETKASGVASHAEGDETKASGVASHAEGSRTTASGALSHAEGNETTASGASSHAEGNGSVSSNASSHAEGIETEASQGASHAEGLKTKATGAASHAEGEETIASGANSHAGGQFSQSNGQNSFAHGLGLIAVNGEAVFGKYNDYEAPDTRLFSVGDGTDDNHRKTVFKVDASGNTWVMINNTLTQIPTVLAGKQDNMVVLDYGTSTWSDFTTAYNKNAIVYCRVRTSTNNYRLAFMAFRSQTTVEFQYLRSINTHDATQQGDQVFVYQLNSSNTWATIIREMVLQAIAGNGVTRTVTTSTGAGTITWAVKAKANGGVTVDSNGVSVTNPVPSYDSSDADKVLGVVSDGVTTALQWVQVSTGTSIYPSLQDAIADAANLSVGDYFETNGFHTSGDGGAARYIVSSTGTANGMDIVQLAAGKYALFQWSNEVTPEQLGAVGDGNTNDTAVFDYIITYFSSVLGDMQVKRTIRGSMGKRYKINALSVHDVCVLQCVFKGTGSTTGYGILLGNRAIIEKCILFDFINAIYTNDSDSAISAVVTGCTISWCGNGISLQSGTSQATSVDNILLENNYISRLGTLGHSSDDTPPNWDNTGCGIWLNGNWKNVNIVNNVLEYNGYAGLRLQCDRTDLEPSCTVTENYFEGNKFSAIRILMQKRPCAVSIFGNQMTKLDTNVFFTTGIYCSSAVMSSGRIESPYGEYLGVVTSNNGSDVLSVNTENLRASNISIYPGALTAKTFQLIPAKCANSRYASRQMLHIDLYVRSPDPSFTMDVSYIDKNNNAQTTSVSLTPNRHEVIEIPLINVNLYDSTNYPVTCVVTSADGWFYIMITDMWIK